MLWMMSPSYLHPHWALCLHFSLSCILALHGGLDHQLLSDTSITSPAFISLHSQLRTQVRKSATGTAASPWLCKAHACQWPEGGKEAGFPGTHKWSALLAGSAEPTGVGGHASEGQPPGVLLLLGKWEVPAPQPKENKPRTVQYTVCCLSDKDRPHCVCSTWRGPNQPKPK